MSKIKVISWSVMVLLLALVAIYQVRNIESQSLANVDYGTLAGQRTQLSAGSTYYQLAGVETGRKVVLVHGFSVPSYIWDPTFEALQAAGYRVLRYDLFGRGFSDRPVDVYNPDFFAQQLFDLTQAVGWDDAVHVVGLSMGGVITARYSALYPQRVRSLSLVDPLTAVHDKLGPLAVPVVGEWLMTAMIVPSLVDGQQGDFFDKSYSKGWAEKYQGQTLIKGFARAVLSTLREFAHYDIKSDYVAVAANKTPVQLFWGRQDNVLPFSDSKLQLEWNPSIEFHPIDKAGHLPHYEKADEVYPLLAAFIDGH